MSVIETRQRDVQSWLKELREMRQFAGAPAEFWPRLLECFGNYSLAQLVILLVRDAEKDEWRRLGTWPKNKMSLAQESPDIRRAVAVARQTRDLEVIVEPATEGTGCIGFQLDLGETQPGASMVFFIPGLGGQELTQLGERLQLLMDIPVFYLHARMLQQARGDVVQFAEAIDLMSLLNECDRFMSAAMTLCNEIAARHECDRVSLGWLDDAYIRVQAISHMEKFEKRMAAVRLLEAAMEEAFDQDEEIAWPKPAETQAVTRDHEQYAREQGLGHVLSLPIRIDDGGTGVITLEREGKPFVDEEIRGLRLIVDQATRHLWQLRRYDRWLGARFGTWCREKLSWFLGVEHTFAKAVGIVVSLALMFVLFGSLQYRVEAPFILKTDAVAYIPAPIDGYVDQVEVGVGDLVQQGTLLLSLDTRELRLEEAMALADISRYSREMEKARAQGALADMRIAQALVAQSEAELDKVRYHINNATMVAPFDGVVVEGDLKEMLGAPVRKGDILFKLADIRDMYVELDVAERDIHEVAVDRTGEIAFVSRPDQKFPFRVVEVDPAAVTKEQGNVFMLRAELETEAANWWRPGMSGVAKVDVGQRNVLWILTHRTVNFFRMLLWW
ncbi:MAG: efflux RND transporter periplasmic adaptor subunit [Pseudomonadota bacterium]